MLAPSSDTTSKKVINGSFPFIGLGPQVYLYVDGEWYEKQDADRLIKMYYYKRGL
jgi:hypothetical protein